MTRVLPNYSNDVLLWSGTFFGRPSFDLTGLTFPFRQQAANPPIPNPKTQNKAPKPAQAAPPQRTTNRPPGGRKKIRRRRWTRCRRIRIARPESNAYICVMAGVYCVYDMAVCGHEYVFAGVPMHREGRCYDVHNILRTDFYLGEWIYDTFDGFFI